VLSCTKDFLLYFEGVDSYYVCVEKHHLSGAYHLHCYLKFVHQYSCNEVREKYLGWFDGTLDVKPCKSSRNWLKYISKEDDEPLHNVAVSRLSFRAQAISWGRCTPFFFSIGSIRRAAPTYV
jgi:hypothetical protein